ncbi:hypothetical protein [Aromatoleum bremense]|nr:hypothetical protein [Aromatoleum bremense]
MAKIYWLPGNGALRRLLLNSVDRENAGKSATKDKAQEAGKLSSNGNRLSAAKEVPVHSLPAMKQHDRICDC